MGYYREIVKDHPDTPQAETASDRIKAIKGNRKATVPPP